MYQRSLSIPFASHVFLSIMDLKHWEKSLCYLLIPKLHIFFKPKRTNKTFQLIVSIIQQTSLTSMKRDHWWRIWVASASHHYCFRSKLQTPLLHRRILDSVVPAEELFHFSLSTHILSDFQSPANTRDAGFWLTHPARVFHFSGSLRMEHSTLWALELPIWLCFAKNLQLTTELTLFFRILLDICHRTDSAASCPKWMGWWCRSTLRRLLKMEIRLQDSPRPMSASSWQFMACQPSHHLII